MKKHMPGIYMHVSFLKKGGLQVCRSILCVAVMLLSNGCNTEKQWQLNDISGHLPDLRFSLKSDAGQTVTDQTYKGFLVLLFFGFTNCQAECPATMFRLAKIVQGLEENANRARILFITVDPARDTPLVMQRYVRAFDAEHTLGLTGNGDEIENLAKRYRIAYRQRESESGDIVHSAVVYVFDRKGHARLMITPKDEIKTVVKDLQHLLTLSR